MPLLRYNDVPDFREDPDAFMDLILNFIEVIGGLSPDVTGILDDDNIAGFSHDSLSDVSENQHHVQIHDVNGTDHVPDADTWHDALTGSHSSLQQGADPSDVGTSSVSVDTADADAIYGTEERDLINELKADLNTAVTDFNAVASKLNTLMANMRAAGQIT
jgi:hypothetical protein